MKDKKKSYIQGAESIVIHNNNVLLGMQKQKRWYTLQNEEQAAIIKTIGGKVEDVDEKNTKKTIIREFFEEVKGIEKKNLIINNNPVFTKSIQMNQINPYESETKLRMNADFYVLEIINTNSILPNDLPALLEIPIKEFIKIQFTHQITLHSVEKYLIRNSRYSIKFPKYCAFMIPDEVKEYLKNMTND
ncbi:MAG: hypothetical protein IKF17_04500 [Clostridia bacterium]|nr:hypothetical protein [Clostridia bacterium]